MRQEWLPIGEDLPIRVFYPLKYSSELNPRTYALAENNFIKMKNDITVLSLPLFAWNISHLFLDVVKDSIEINIIAAPESEREHLEWSIDFLDYPYIEDNYVALLLSDDQSKNSRKSPVTIPVPAVADWLAVGETVKRISSFFFSR